MSVTTLGVIGDRARPMQGPSISTLPGDLILDLLYEPSVLKEKVLSDRLIYIGRNEGSIRPKMRLHRVDCCLVR